eukprot:9811604-Alexandrium_andersonii.AAC.1
MGSFDFHAHSITRSLQIRVKRIPRLCFIPDDTSLALLQNSELETVELHVLMRHVLPIGSLGGP